MLKAVAFETSHFMYLIVFCLKALLTLEWGLFIFPVPQNFYFLAFSSVSKGWFIKQKRESTWDRNCNCLQLLQCFASSGRNHRQVSGSTQETWARTVGVTLPLQGGGVKVTAWLWSWGYIKVRHVVIFSHSQQSKTLNPGEKKKNKPKPWLMVSVDIAEKEGQKGKGR